MSVHCTRVRTVSGVPATAEILAQYSIYSTATVPAEKSSGSEKMMAQQVAIF